MTNIYTAISLGLFKLAFVIFLLFFIIRKYFFLKRDFVYIFDGIIRKCFEYQSLLIVILFITINLKIYDGIIVGIIMFLIGLCDYLNIINPLQTPAVVVKKFKKRFLHIINLIEQKQINFSTVVKIDRFGVSKKNEIVLNSLAFLILSIIIISYYFIRYDHYLFSSFWFDVLESINAKDQYIWFTRDVCPEAIYAYINYFSRVTNSSPEISIYVFCVYLIILVIVTIFWFIQKMSESKIIVPILVSVFYIIGFSFLPFNITNFFQSSTIHLAFTIFIPLFYYNLSPNLLPYSKRKKRLHFLIAFIAIGLIDLYLYLFFVPLTLILSVIFYINKKSNFRFEVLIVYLVSLLIIFLLYYYYLYQFSQTIFDLLRKTLISVESYFYNPFISISVDKLLFYYQLFFSLGVFLIILLAFFYKIKWKKNIIFFISVSTVILATQFTNIWLDHDLLLRLLSILLPIQTGLSLFSIIKLLKIFLKKEYYYSYRGVIIIITTIVVFIFLEKPALLYKKEYLDFLNEDVLSVNEYILHNYLDRTYMVVNRDEFVNLSSGKRYFLSYEEFLSNKYKKQDSVYAKYVNNNKYLLKHPKIILPSSVFLFIYNDKVIGVKTHKNLLNKLKELKNKGRNNRLIFRTERLVVYEIINKPQSSEINELVF